MTWCAGGGGGAPGTEKGPLGKNEGTLSKEWTSATNSLLFWFRNCDERATEMYSVGNRRN